MLVFSKFHIIQTLITLNFKKAVHYIISRQNSSLNKLSKKISTWNSYRNPREINNAEWALTILNIKHEQVSTWPSNQEL